MRLSAGCLTFVIAIACERGGPVDAQESDLTADTHAADTDGAQETDTAPVPDTATETDPPRDSDPRGDTDAAPDSDDTDIAPETDLAPDTDTDTPTWCGDGYITSPETCDDQHDTIPYDGCTGCQVDNGWWCYGEPSYCVVL